MKKIVVIIFSCIFMVLQLKGQTDTTQFDSDALYKVGRELAFAKKRDRARFWLQKAIDKSPNYLDVRIFLARTYGWDKMYREAAKELDFVLEKDPKNKDAIMTFIDIYKWSDKDKQTLRKCNYGLRYYPTDPDLLYEKAKAQKSLEDNESAVITLRNLLTLYPSHPDGLAMMEELRIAFMFDAISVGYSIDQYSAVYNTFHFANIAYGRITKAGSLKFRLNAAQRFGTKGYQGEIDFYPSLGKRMYGYMNYGYSSTDLFPDHRIGLEVFRSLPLKLEASLGLRYLDFSTSQVSIYTGSLGWYVGSFWLNARVYITPDRDINEESKSLTLRARYYFSNPQNYIGASVGIGYSPEAQIEPNEPTYFFRSRKVGLEYQQPIGDQWEVKTSVGLSDLELPFSRGNFTNILSGSISLEYRF